MSSRPTTSGLTPRMQVSPNGMSNSAISLSNLRVDENVNRRNERPTSGPEIDDMETGDSGVDDGLLEPRNRRPSVTPSGRPYTPAMTPVPGGSGISGIPFDPNTVPGSRVDINVYQQKKTLAQGMMDLALLSANANQLRYVLDYKGPNPYFYPSVLFIGLSILFQILVGIGLILNSRYNVKRDRECHLADRINNFTVIGIFIVTLTNVFISAFSVTDYGNNMYSQMLVWQRFNNNSDVSFI